MGEETIRIDLPSYKPSLEAWKFHLSGARYRFLIWGIQSGKTAAGAVELVRGALGSPEGSISWVVAPTYQHLQVSEREVLKILRSAKEHRLVLKHRTARHEILLPGDRMVQFRSAEKPDNLRGPTITGPVWVDEGAFMKAEGWWIVTERVAASGAPIFVTTTPRGRNWVWQECKKANIPHGAPYGVFESDEYFVSHYPTEQFPWVSRKHIDNARRTMPREVFEQEYGAQFVGGSAQVFPNVLDCLSREPIPTPDKLPKDYATVLGLDLAKYQDRSAVVVMGPDGRILWCDCWSRAEWAVQKARVNELVAKWHAVVVIDRSNAGSVIEEDLKKMGLTVYPVDMNSPQVKSDLIEGLMLTFERKGIKLPDPSCSWAPPAAKHLIDELDWYERKLTPSKRISYGAPKGLTDDLVIATALADQGRKRGLAGSSGPLVGVAMSRDEFDGLKVTEAEKRMRKAISRPRSKVMGKHFRRGHKSSLGFESFGRFW